MTSDDALLDASIDRLDHLLALDFVGMLDESEREELESLLASRDDAAGVERSLAETASRFTLASAGAGVSLHNALRERLLASAQSHLPEAAGQAGSASSAGGVSLPFPIRGPGTSAGRGAADRSRSGSPFRTMFAVGGYLLAACLVVVFIVQNRNPSDRSADAAAERMALLVRQGVVQVPWKTTDAANPATGDVVWSPADQTGYMRFANFKPNNPSQSQYQLWIFDRNRPEATPVDGGVFDVPAGKSEVVVPIRPTLPVSRATLFAITEEPPGGVVVSDRKQLHLIAPTP